MARVTPFGQSRAESLPTYWRKLTASSRQVSLPSPLRRRGILDEPPTYPPSLSTFVSSVIHSEPASYDDLVAIEGQNVPCYFEGPRDPQPPPSMVASRIPITEDCNNAANEDDHEVLRLRGGASADNPAYRFLGVLGVTNFLDAYFTPCINCMENGCGCGNHAVA